MQRLGWWERSLARGFLGKWDPVPPSRTFIELDGFSILRVVQKRDFLRQMICGVCVFIKSRKPTQQVERVLIWLLISSPVTRLVSEGCSEFVHLHDFVVGSEQRFSFQKLLHRAAFLRFSFKKWLLLTFSLSEGDLSSPLFSMALSR